MSIGLIEPVTSIPEPSRWSENVVLEPGKQFLSDISAFSSTEAKTAAYSAIYGEIGFLEDEIRSLEESISQKRSLIKGWMSRRNALSSCFKLPNEIWIEIWKHLAHNHKNLSTSWVRVTHVCSYWRSLALNTPVLWTLPCLHRPEIALEMLKRAGSFKLTLVFNIRTLLQGGSAGRNVLPLVLSQASSVIADFSAIRSNYGGFLGMALKGVPWEVPTPLEYIEITYPQFSSTHVRQTIDKDVVSLIRDSPNLKTLLLDGTSLFLPGNRTIFERSAESTPSPGLRSITTLTVTFIHSPNDQMVSVTQVLRTLQHLPHLTNLTLEDTFSPLRDNDIDWCATLHEPVPLVHLRHIYLVSSARPISVFLEHISYHPQASIELWSSGSHVKNHTRLSYHEAIRNVLQTITHRFSPFINGVALAASTVGWKLQFFYRQNSRIICDVNLFMEPMPELVPRLTELCPLSHVQTLVYQLPFSNMDIWKSFGTLEELSSLVVDPAIHVTIYRVLVLHRGSSDTIFDCVVDAMESNPVDPNRRKSHLYFPQMTTLKLVHSTTRSKKMELPLKEECSRISRARSSLYGRLNLSDHKNTSSAHASS